MQYRIRSIIAVILFFLMTGGAYVFGALFPQLAHTENNEKRVLAEKPVFDPGDLDAYTEAVEAYINDHIPFRDSMILVNSAVEYYVFRTSLNELVMLGKDGWLMYGAADNTAFNTGTKQYTEDELRQMAISVRNTQQHMERDGIRFALLIVPNRERVYPEYLPDSYRLETEHSALNQVLTFLRDHTDVTVVYPYDSIMAEKQKTDYLYYHKADTHWNLLGAYIAVRDVWNAFDIPYSEDDLRVEWIRDEVADMSSLIHLDGVYDAGDTCTVSGYRADADGKWMICGDSFREAMLPVLYTVCPEVVEVHHENFSFDSVRQEAPRYFVREVSERGLDLLLNWDYKEETTLTIPEYLATLNNPRYTVFFAAKDDASQALTEEILFALADLGLQTDLRGQLRSSYIGIITAEGVTERAGYERLSYEGIIPGTAHTFSVSSAGFDTGNIASVEIDGKEYCLNRRGLNVVVYDNETGRVTDAVALDTNDKLTVTR